MKKAKFDRLETIPLNEEIEGGHGKSQPSFESVPSAVGEMPAMATSAERGKHRFNDHADVPVDYMPNM